MDEQNNNIAFTIIGLSLVGFGALTVYNEEFHSSFGYAINFGENHRLIGITIILAGAVVLWSVFRKWLR